MSLRKPVVALVGRPNVGKSTLFNRLTGSRTAIVEDIPGTTRDRIYGDSDWNGVGFIVVDTGGLEAPADMEAARRQRPLLEPLAEDSAQFITHIQNQANVAMEEADVIVFVVDGKEGLTAGDEDVAEVLRGATRPVFLAVNKTESPERRLNAVEFWTLGLGEPYPISAYHGDGVGDLLDEIVKELPAYPFEEAADEDVVSIAIVGRPNVGKSSLLNALIGTDRAIVSEVPGTTRTPSTPRSCSRSCAHSAYRHGRNSPAARWSGHHSALRSLRGIDRADVVAAH
ncbi:MAG: GTPase [Caldilineaceae bacterium]